MRRGRKIFFVFAILFLSLLYFIQYYANSHKSQIADFAIAQVNKHLNAKIKFDTKNIEVEALFSLPNINLKLPEVLIESNGSKLLSIESVSIGISFFDLFKSSKEIDEIILEGGIIYFEKDRKGKVNYDIFKDQQKSNSFSLPNIKLSDVLLVYKDYTYEKGQLPRSSFVSKISQADLAISVNDQEIQILANMETVVEALKTKSAQYFDNVDIDASADVVYNRTSAELFFRQSLIQLFDAVFPIEASGIINFKAESHNQFDIELNTSSIKTKALKLFMQKIDQDLLGAEFKNGSWDINTRIIGPMASWVNPDLSINLSLDKMNYVSSSIELDNICFEGQMHIPNKGSTGFKIDSFNLELLDKYYNGNGVFTLNQEDYKSQLTLNGNFDLSLFNKFQLVSPSFKINSGLLKLKDAVIKLDADSYSKMPKISLQSDFSILDLDFIYDQFYQIKSAQVSGSYDNELINLSQSNYSLNGELFNYIGKINFRKQQPIFEGKISSNRINLMSCIRHTDEPIVLEDIFNFNLNIDIQDVYYDRLKIDYLKCRLRCANSKIVFDDFTLTAFNGDINGYGFLNQFSRDDLYLNISGLASNLDVSKLFYQLNDFGQSTLTHKHLQGDLIADFNMSLSCDNMLNIDTKSIDFDGDTKIKAGSLINFKPLEELSDYIDIKELRNIKFKDLANQIKISNEIVSFPSMRVYSNAINIEIEGTHSFDNIVDYKLRMKLSSLLSKRKNMKGLQEEIDFDEKGFANLYLLMKGDLEDPDIMFDTKRTKQKVKQNIKAQGTRIKDALKVELGKQKNKQKLVDQEEGELEFIDWDDQ